MLYLISLAVVSLVLLPAIFQHWLAMMEHLSSGGAKPRPPLLQPFLLCAVMLSMSAPLVTTLGFVGGLHGGNSARGSVLVALAGALLCVGFSLWQLRGYWSSSQIGFWRTGKVVALAGAGVLVATASVQHLAFFTSNADGWANLDLIRDVATVDDMPGCNNAVVLIHARPDGMVDYRCPQDVLFNRETSEPFAPWPGYVEGTSMQLPKALKLITDQAQHLE